MRIKIRVDNTTPAHITFAVFSDGAFCGRLIMRIEEYALFTFRLKAGTTAPGDFTIENAPVIPYTGEPDVPT